MTLTTTNDLQLKEYAEKMGLPLLNILMRDEMDEINKDGFYIINLDNSNGTGTHWTSLFYHPLNSYYFDSYGFVAPFEVEQKIKPYICNDADIQDFNSKACGYYGLAFIKFLNDKTNKEVAFKEFLRLFKDNTKENDDILKKYLNLMD
jgi:hypothetical protein